MKQLDDQSTTNQTQPALTLGEELRRRREAAGIDLNEIAAATCIGVRFLRAIEENDFKALPGGLFTRSFIRAYAHHVGMDENAAIRLYFQQTGESEPQLHHPLSEAARAKARPSPWANVAIVLAVLLVLILGGIAGMHHWRRSPSTKQTPTVQTTPVGQTESGSQAPGQLPPTMAPAAEPPPARPESAPPDTVLSPEPSASAAQPTSPPSPVEPSPQMTETPQPPPQSVAHDTLSTETEPTALPTQLDMSIRATGDCWVWVQADGAMPRSENLRSGDRRVFTAKERLIISARNAHHLEVTINGQTVKLPQSGSAIGGVIITPRNLSQFTTP